MTIYTTRAAAHECGVSPPTIAKHAKRIGLGRVGRSYRITEPDIERLKESIRNAVNGRPKKQSRE